MSHILFCCFCYRLWTYKCRIGCLVVVENHIKKAWYGLKCIENLEAATRRVEQKESQWLNEFCVLRKRVSCRNRRAYLSITCDCFLHDLIKIKLVVCGISNKILEIIVILPNLWKGTSWNWLVAQLLVEHREGYSSEDLF